MHMKKTILSIAILSLAFGSCRKINKSPYCFYYNKSGGQMLTYKEYKENKFYSEIEANRQPNVSGAQIFYKFHHFDGVDSVFLGCMEQAK